MNGANNLLTSQIYDITVILTAHAEGRLIHRTLRSVGSAIDHALFRGIRCEIIVVADNADGTTAAYLKTRLPAQNCQATAYHVSFADPGLARNYGAEKATGKYVAFVDGDDLISKTWLSNAFQVAEQSGMPTVCCPEYLITFENQNSIIKYKGTRDEDFYHLNLMEYNSWSSFFLVSRTFFLAHPFCPTPLDSGFGYEDWHWYLQAIANGAEVLTVPGTVAFYRRKATGSRLLMHGRNSVVCPKSDFFDVEFLERYSAHNDPVQAETPVNQKTRLALQGSVRKRFFWVTDRIFTAFPGLYPWLQQKGILGKVYDRTTAFPQWLLEEWQGMNALEPQLFPDQETLQSICWYTPVRTRIAQPYIDLAHLWGNEVSHVFFVPWLKRGGADRVVINYLRALVEMGGHRGIVVIADRNDDSPWSSLLPEGVKFIEFGKLFAHWSPDEREQVMVRLIIQSEPKVIHNINSELCYQLLLKYGRAISRISRVFTSVFCYERTPEGKIVGFPFKYLDLVFDYQVKILFENRYFMKYLSGLYGFDEEKLSLLYTPFEQPQSDRKPGKGDSAGLDILWAGRFDRQKRPDILIRIVEACADKPFTFHVYGGALLSHDIYTNQLQRLPNVKLYGTFDGLHSLPLSDYDVFLFTSEFEGIPTIILDALAARLPVIASAVGGIPEVIIDNKTGILVDPYDDVMQYVRALVGIHNGSYDLHFIIDNASRHMATQHSWQVFKDALTLTEGYSI